MQVADFKKTLGELIVTLRGKVGLSQEALAHDAGIDRTRLGEIERGEANPTIDTLDKIAKVLKQTLGSLVIQAEDVANGRIAPSVNSSYVNRAVSLPKGLTHEQLELALNQAMVILDQIGINPDEGDIQANIFSGAVSNLVTKAIGEVSGFVQNKDTAHPDLYNPKFNRNDPDWGLEMKATKKPNKGAESHNPGHGWFMVVVYKVIAGQTHIIQVEVARLEDNDWVIHERGAASNRTRTANTKEEATKRLRENSVYLNPEHVLPVRAAR